MKTVDKDHRARAAGIALIACIAWFLPWLVAHADLSRPWLSIPFVLATLVVVAASLVSVVNRWQRAVPAGSGAGGTGADGRGHRPHARRAAGSARGHRALRPRPGLAERPAVDADQRRRRRSARAEAREPPRPGLSAGQPALPPLPGRRSATQRRSQGRQPQLRAGAAASGHRLRGDTRRRRSGGRSPFPPRDGGPAGG